MVGTRRPIARRGLLHNRLRAIHLMAALAALGCRDASLAAPSSQEPFLYLIISAEPLARRFVSPADTAIQALLLTAGSAAGAPFRSAELFSVTSLTDGATFTFIEQTATPLIPGVGRDGASVDDGNYVLPFSSSPSSRGASDFQPFGTYDLRVETEGRVVTGRVVIPGRPQPVILLNGGKRFVTFPLVSGAAAYLVGGDTELNQHIITTNMVQLFYDVDPAFVPANPEYRVIALDSNLVRYMSDAVQARSGIEGAFGLFGATSSARIAVPWP